MEILTSEEMRRIDAHAIRRMKIPSLCLMECAGLRVVEAIQTRFPDIARRRVAVLCGKGNNGGDGFVVARHLAGRGIDCRVILAADPRGLSGDARVNYRAARGAGVPIEIASTARAWAVARRTVAECDLIVDALLGTGLTGPARGLIGKILSEIGKLDAPVVAVDLPSGLSGDSSEVPGPAVNAVLTVALCRPKIAHLLPPACLRTGDLEIADIGIPPAAVATVRPRIFTIEQADVARVLPVRARDAHKGTFGHALIVAGAPGKAGAAALAARAALRAGAGLVTAASPAAARPEVASFAPEVMTSGIPEGDPGAALDYLLSECAGKSAVALGPGLGRAPKTVTWIRRFVAGCPVPLVLDADGLNSFGGSAPALARGRHILVLTPHPGEMARLLAVPVREVLRDRIGAARALARAAKAIVVLKGMATLVATPDGHVYVNGTGNPGMATGGSGDVLTGLLAGLLAQRPDPLGAVLLGVRIHGRAGDLAAAALGEAGLVAGDILDRIPAALRELAS